MIGRHATTALLALSSLGASACSDERSAGGGSVDVRISGERAATDGFSFPSGSEVTFLDGWELRFTHVLVTVSDLTLSENPDQSPADPSQTGAPVAKLAGPWAVDLALPGDATAAGGEGSAVPLARFSGQNLRNDEPFANDERYAFGYRIAPATAGASRVNFAGDAATEALYERMIERGYTMLYAGTATFRGAACVTSDLDYDFAELPTSVPFELGFVTPTSYENCQNQENQGDPFEGEEYQRGIAVLANQAALAQITLHLEHPFFSDTVHDSPVYFDQLAARLAGAPPRTTLESESLAGVDPTAFTDGRGRPLPWRQCLAGQQLPVSRQRGFGVGHVLVDRAGEPREAFRGYLDLMSYLVSTEGHLNGGEGLCYVNRAYPSPP
ncbi:MAG TPA: hypothetical protein VFV94_00220 [Polyangiaceae bacterium]|nr:hypothetical protein [Polyangiaceae bacterium]